MTIKWSDPPGIAKSNGKRSNGDGDSNPHGFATRGAAFWSSVQETFELTIDETELLIEVCRSLDRCDALQEILERDGLMSIGSMGQPVLHPAVGALRGVELTLSRLLSQLALPDPHGRSIASPEHLRAVRAANARWASHRPGGA